MTNRAFYLQHSAAEFPRFVGVMQATADFELDYRPHPRSRSAYEIIGHLIGHEQDLVELTATGTINHRMQVPFRTLADGLAAYREAHETLQRQIADMSEPTWESPGRLLFNGQVFYETTRRDLAWMLLFDAVHHRGQLSTYLRPMGGTVPAIYGASADSVPAAV